MSRVFLKKVEKVLKKACGEENDIRFSLAYIIDEDIFFKPKSGEIFSELFFKNPLTKWKSCANIMEHEDATNAERII